MDDLLSLNSGLHGLFTFAVESLEENQTLSSVIDETLLLTMVKEYVYVLHVFGNVNLTFLVR